VVPVTAWNASYTTIPWLVLLEPTAHNGLTKKPAADCFQVKSVSLSRFVTKLGDLRADTVEEISAAIALCVGA
jgi:mRNA interferase MazF